MPHSHQLAAIMFTDIVGYTAMMGRDSNQALELVRISKAIQKPLVEKHHGQWLKEMGDGVLMRFQSAMSAVNCAVEIQAACRAGLDAQLRIGIHLGEITIEENDIYGDGVNVASRLESIADPGGICISEAVEKAITGLSNHDTSKLGRRSFKNVRYPVTVYTILGVGLPRPKSKRTFDRRVITAVLFVLTFALGLYLGTNVGDNGGNPKSGRYSIVLPPDRPLEFIGTAPLNMGRPNIAISQDGQTIIYLSSVQGIPKLFKRAIDSYETTEIIGTEFAYNPIFSPDGKQVAFFSGGKLKVTSLNGTQGKELGSITNPYGMVWMPDGRIIVANNEASRLVSLNAEGVNTSPQVIMSSSATYLWPTVIGDQDILTGSYDMDIRQIDLATGHTTIVQGITSEYVKFLPTGQLLFVSQDALFSVPFSAKKRSIVGTPIKVLDGFRMEGHTTPQLDVSANGTIVYAPGQPVTKANFVVLGRDGKEQPLSIAAEHYGTFRYNSSTNQITTSTLWEQDEMLIIDLERGIRKPVKFNGKISHGAFVISENDDTVYTVVSQGEVRQVIRKSIITSESKILHDDKALITAYEKSPSGDLLISAYGAGNANTDILALSQGDSSSITAVASTDAHEWGPRVSPKGDFVAYTSDETGRYEVYVKKYPVTQKKWQISNTGGEEPIWINENKIIYRYQDYWYTVDINWRGSDVQISKPVMAFSGNYTNPPGHSYDVWDEDHILVLKPKDERRTTDRVNIITNWFDEFIDQQ